MHGLALAGMLTLAALPVPAEPPVPARTLPQVCTAGACVGGARWDRALPGVRAIPGGRRMDVFQDSARATFLWESFDIARGNVVQFHQPDRNAVALNKVLGLANPASIINGALRANGQVYLINRNGIVFGKDARVDVHTLVASTLDLDPVAEAEGLHVPIRDGEPALVLGEQAGHPIVIEQGAVIETATLGRILMFAPGTLAEPGGDSITNHGTLRARDGQVLLAAGDKVYLLLATDPRQGIPGFLVEVDVGGVITNGDLAANGGAITPEQLVGRIFSERGNATILARSVNQDGLVSATTAVQQKGTVRLLARHDTSGVIVNPDDPSGFLPTATAAGDLRLGRSSVTEVMPETDPEAVAPDATPQPASSVELMGELVELQAHSRVGAPAGTVTATATANPSLKVGAGGGGRIHLAAGAAIDVSGMQITRPLSDNLVTLDLRADELKDRPLQRDGVLRGATVTVDMRKRGTLADGSGWEGTPVADIAGSIDTIQRGVLERSLLGGTIRLRAGSDVVVAPGAVLDVSGGAIHYQGGYLATTRLLSQGRVVDIGAADPDQVYDAVFGQLEVLHEKWGVLETFDVLGPAAAAGSFEPAYVEGKDAGALELDAANVMLLGDLRAQAVAGRLQRTPATSAAGRFSAERLYRPAEQVPVAGSLTLGVLFAAPPSNFRVEDVVFARGPVAAVPAARDPLPPAVDAVYLPPALVAASGLGRIDVLANGRVRVPAASDLTLAAGGRFGVVAGEVEIAGRITVPAGAIELAGQGTVSRLSGRVSLGPAGQLSAAGLWVNDNPALTGGVPQGPVFVDGGSVSVSNQGADFFLEAGSRIDVSAGAWLQPSGVVRGGDGGSIALIGPLERVGTELLGFGVETGRGGSLRLDPRRGLRLAEQPAAAEDVFDLGARFFDQGGFARFDLTARTSATLVAGTDLAPRVRTRFLEPGAGERPTGTLIGALTRAGTRPSFEAEPMTLALAALEEVRLEPGSRIELPPGSTFAARAEGRVVAAGTVSAPAGTITLTESDTDVRDQIGERRRLGVFLEPGAILAAPGAVRVLPDDERGLRRRQVLDAGTVRLVAENGYVVAAAGSQLDVSGVTETFETLAGATEPRTVTAVGEAGRVELAAAEGIVLQGDMNAAPAPVDGARGGELVLTLGSSAPIRNLDTGLLSPPIPETPRTLVISAQGAPALPEGFQPGDDLPDSLNGLAVLDPGALAAAGFDALDATVFDLISTDNLFTEPRRVANGTVRLEGDPVLGLRRSIRLDASVVASDGGAGVLRSHFLSLGPSETATDFRVPTTAVAGEGRLSLHADNIELVGRSVFNGFERVELRSTGDIRFRGVQRQQTSTLEGGILADAELVFDAAQLYPTTFSRIEVISGPATDTPSGRIRIGGGAGEGPVLSAGGRLAFAAATLEQAGVVKAPLGGLVFTAGTLAFLPGSLTSTSAEDLIVPFGQIQAGQDWVFGLNSRTLVFDGADNPLPEKRIELAGEDIDIRAGARLDVSGGGDLLAFEFVSGVQGSRDFLDSAVSPDTYAILPRLDPRLAPFDPIYSADGAPGPGETVTLDSGVFGVDPGTYTLLPARYALLPDAFLVRVGGVRDLRPDQVLEQADGSRLVAARLGVAGAGVQEARSRGVALLPGSEVGRFGQYDTARATAFFQAKAAAGAVVNGRLPIDSGRLGITAGRSLVLAGGLRQRAPGDRGSGLGPVLDIASEQIAVVERAADASALVGLLGVTAEELDTGFLKLEADQLEAFGADSLLLGGTRSAPGATDAALFELADEALGDTRKLDVTSSRVLIDDLGSGGLRVGELLLAARAGVGVRGGARIIAAGPDRPDQTLLVEGDGALLALSGLQAITVDRRAPAGGPALGTSGQGVLEVQAGAALRATRSLVLDATEDLNYAARSLDVAGALTLSANRIALGEFSEPRPGLVLSGAQLAALNATDLVLASRAAIDVNGIVDLGFDALTLRGAGVQGAGAASDIALTTSGRLRLENPAGADPGAGGSGGGSLALGAQTLALGRGDFRISGFSRVTLAATGALLAEGDGALTVAFDPAVADAGLILSASVVGGARGVDHAVRVRDGDLYMRRPAAVPGAAPLPGVAARLTFASDRDLVFGGRVIDPSGIVSLEAGRDLLFETGPGAAPRIDLAGSDQLFGGVVRGMPGGHLTLAAGRDLRLDGQIRVSGAAAGGDAGSIEMFAPGGEFSIAGELAAAARAGAQGGGFSADLLSLSGGAFTTLNALLETGGFSGYRRIRTREGDLHLGSGQTMTAHEIALTADGGAVTLGDAGAAGAPPVRLDAAGSAGGRIALAARDDLRLYAGAELDASAAGDNRPGGRVFIGTTDGVLHLDPGVRIRVAGAPGEAGGRVILRAPRVGGSDIALNPGTAVAAEIFEGAARVDAEAYVTSSDASIGAADISALRTATAVFMDTHAGAIEQRLGWDGNDTLHLVPGIEIRSGGELSLDAEWNMGSFISTQSWRFGPEAQPGHLTLRAAGDLVFNEDLSDGFLTADGFGLRADHSWSLRLVAGADLASADPLAVIDAQLAGGAGSVVVAPGLAGSPGFPPFIPPTPADTRLVRTGTGDIDLAAALDFHLASERSLLYTAGAASGGTPLSRLPAAYPDGGGNLRIRAGRDASGAPSAAGVDAWWWREGGIKPTAFGAALLTTTGWTVNFATFEQGIGALGGGDVTVTAGGDVHDLSVAVPSIGRQDGPASFDPLVERLDEVSVVTVVGGGDLEVVAGGDILGGSYFVGRGSGHLRAGGSVAVGGIPAGAGAGRAPVLSVAQGDFRVSARQDLTLDGVVHPTLLERPASQTNSNVNTLSPQDNFFFLFEPGDALHLQALAGDVTLRAQGSGGLADVAPPDLVATAFLGDVIFDGRTALFPAPQGKLELLAAGELRLAETATLIVSDVDPGLLPRPDTPVVKDPARTDPIGVFSVERAFDVGVDPFKNAAVPVHGLASQPPGSGPDNAPVLLVAREGDVVFETNARLELAKRFHIEAGRDLLDLAVRGQNVHATDVSLLRAGRDLRYPVRRDSADGDILPGNNLGIEVGGPGRLDVIAGRDLDLGASGGLVTTGNSVNPALPEGGATVTVLVGRSDRPDFGPYLDFLAEPALLVEFVTMLDRGADLDLEAIRAAIASRLPAFVEGLGASLVDNVAQTLGVRAEQGGSMTRAALEALFAGTKNDSLLGVFQPLDPPQLAWLYAAGLQQRSAPGSTAVSGTVATSDPQRVAAIARALRPEDVQPLVYDVFFNELRESGRFAVESGSEDFRRGMANIALLFPDQGAAGSGDARLFFSQIRTLDGGGINLLVPDGQVNAGLASPPTAFGFSKGAADLGIVAERSGPVNSLSGGDFLVNESRVFTGDGGDILMWSVTGDLDAGRGAKTALSAAADTVGFDAQGNNIRESRPSLAGSGIRAFRTTVDKAGNVDLFAPQGAVNAADAGIAGENVTLGATEVIGADNIDVGGAASGFSAGVSPTISTSLGAAASTAGTSASRSALSGVDEDAAGTGGEEVFGEQVISIITVEVIGFGS